MELSSSFPTTQALFHLQLLEMPALNSTDIAHTNNGASVDTSVPSVAIAKNETHQKGVVPAVIAADTAVLAANSNHDAATSSAPPGRHHYSRKLLSLLGLGFFLSHGLRMGGT